jgi:hypothetical protein
MYNGIQQHKQSTKGAANMKAKKIIAPNGMYSIIGLRADEEKFGNKIKSISSTEPQPFFAANHTADGVCVGGRTMQKSLAELTIKNAIEKDFRIEDIDL